MTFEIPTPGSQNQLADGFSRLPSPDNVTTIDLDLRVDLVRFSPERLDQVRLDTSLDAVLNQLIETTIAGWPEDVNYLPTYIFDHSGISESVENVLVLKGQQLVNPRMQQPEILRQLYTAHLGTEKTKLLARDTVYWLNINKDIDRLVQTCNVCQEHQPSQTPEPLQQHDIPSKSWSVLGTDLSEFGGQRWFIIADYYTKYPIIRCFHTANIAALVISILKENRPISLLRKGSPSRRLWESPPIPTERYARRPCLGRFRCTCRSSDFFTIRQKRIRGGSTFAEGNSEPLKRHLLLAQPHHCLTATPS